MSRPPDPGRSAAGLPLLAVAALLAAACAGEEGPTGEERTTAVLEARTRGMVHLERDRLDSARASFRRLAELAPAEGSGPANLALVALRAGDVEEAGRQARRALEREPDDPWIHLVLARALEAAGRPEEARSERRRSLELDPGNLRALWTLAGGASEGPGAPAPDARRAELLARILERAPGSLPARLELAATRAALGDAEAVAVQLEEVRALVPGLPEGADAPYERALARARAGDAAGALGPLTRAHDLLRTTSAYRADLDELEGPRGEATGFPVLTFSHELSVDVPDEGAVLEALRLADATGPAGLGTVGGSGGTSGAGAAASGAAASGPDGLVLAPGDLDGDRDVDLFAWRPEAGGGRGFLLRNDLGEFVDVTPPSLREVEGVRAATWADVDADGLVDLYLVRRGADRLYRNAAGDGLEDVSAEAGVPEGGDGRTALFADLDHDGDLDLLVGGDGPTRLFRNDGRGRFREVADAMGLGAVSGVRDASFADVDLDGDLDLVLAAGGEGVVVYANRRQDRFAPVPDSAGPGGGPRADAVAVGDLDNDGRPDLVTAGRGAPPALYRGAGDGLFRRDERSAAVLGGAGPAGAGAELLDVDNDGRLDLFLGGRLGTGRPALLHNEGPGVFADRTDLLAADLPSGHAASAFDYNEDGDLDLLVATSGGPRLLRNDGGNVNHYLDLRLVARGPGSGKVNRFGIGSKVEVRAGDLYQSRTVRGPVTHVGLGRRLKAEVVRIVWTNGVPQYLHFPASEQELVESQELKGSCAFVYAWDGEGFSFVTDAMWRSALGMPMGIMGGPGTGRERVYAPPAASREYLRIPGDRLRPLDGRYRLQITEELWETAYVDEVRLLAVDHPDSTDVFVDERFVPPAPPRLRLYRVDERLAPASATDLEGDDVADELRAADGRYVTDLLPGPYQGVVEPHAIVLELPPAAARAEDPVLFLRGWIFPTDASINVALSQADGRGVSAPRIEVPDGRGGWRTAIPDAGFPSGKDKTVVVELGDVVPEDDPRIRVVTSMQVYWDQAFFAAGGVAGPVVEGDAETAAARSGREAGGGEAAAAPTGRRPGDAPRLRLLRPSAADLHHRGFSREYRRGGRHGPHWFDYDDVTDENPWLPITGRFTRYGDVLPLLDASDDRYVVMAPGDEMTLSFEADDAAEPPEGWTRTFLLYTDGWIKDADLNTAHGHRVGPLPFHAQSAYPHPPGESYPREARRDYLERYQTREVEGTILRLAPGQPGS